MNHPLKISIRIMCGDEIAMGPGKADLLDAIAASGSISAAGRAMGMSYRRAWLLVDAMNRCWAQPLVETMPSGAARSGARLTLAGEQVLGYYRRLQMDAKTIDKGEEWQALEAALLPAPKDHQ
ncbi:LysR family transcriptional regulator [Novosphingobium umbonatum]|uniref:LysR family transcriptional regulator n=1 Tax=Novosphingobium umbonatum TaxID=1908524 RepID=A0A3S2VAA6_9SPHN|nr:LysR family transcriptional regulator [Novosphingobium umbonatum]RVU07659.1 LysR family transcriptional regulator [Novosphingobium umbonatum]